MNQNDEKVLNKLVEFGKAQVEQIKKKESPEFVLPTRGIRNVYFDEEKKLIQSGSRTSKRTFTNIGHAKKYMRTIAVAAKLKELIDENIQTTSIRDLFYTLKKPLPGSKENIFDEERESNPVIEDLEIALGLLREEFHLVAESKGQLVGGLTVVEHGEEEDTVLDCTHLGSGGWSIPSNVEPYKIEFQEMDFDYILAIEKGAVWNRFNEDKFWKKHNCLIVTAKGQMDRGTRRLIHRLHTESGKPVYALMDADPYGYYIYSVMKQGSMALVHTNEHLATPSAKYIGLTTLDVETFDIPKRTAMKLTEADKSMLKSVSGYPWFKHKEWQKELENMKKKNYKLELEALSSKGFRFITEEYLPEKIENKLFLP